MKNTYHGVFDLDLLPGAIKWLNWGFCYIIATGMSFWGIFQVMDSYLSIRITTPLYWLSVISSTSIAVAWLRLTGVKWRYALSLFLYVPGTVFSIFYLFLYLVTLFYWIISD